MKWSVTLTDRLGPEISISISIIYLPSGTRGVVALTCVRNKEKSFASCAFAFEGSWLVVKLECASD